MKPLIVPPGVYVEEIDLNQYFKQMHCFLLDTSLEAVQKYGLEKVRKNYIQIIYSRCQHITPKTPLSEDERMFEGHVGFNKLKMLFCGICVPKVAAKYGLEVEP